jgi:hypothetical protein
MGANKEVLIRRLGLGAAAGVFVAVMSWRGNHTDGLVSVFPDGLTFAALILLLTAANRLERRHLFHTWKSSLTIAAAAGVTFGCGLVLLALRRFSTPTFSLLGSIFVMTCLCALGCGWLADRLSTRSGRRTA